MRSWDNWWMVVNHLNWCRMGGRLDRWRLGQLRMGSERVRWTGSSNEDILLILCRVEDS